MVMPAGSISSSSTLQLIKDAGHCDGCFFTASLSAWSFISFVSGMTRAELRSCVKVQVAVLGFPSLISLMVSVDVQQH